MVRLSGHINLLNEQMKVTLVRQISNLHESWLSLTQMTIAHWIKCVRGKPRSYAELSKYCHGENQNCVRTCHMYYVQYVEA